jgi:hypothetical protein
MPFAVAEQNIGVGPRRGEKFGDMLKAMARISPSQPNEEMAPIAPRRTGTISLDPSRRSTFPSKVLWVQPRSEIYRIPMWCSDFRSKLRATHRATPLGPLVRGANKGRYD